MDYIGTWPVCAYVGRSAELGISPKADLAANAGIDDPDGGDRPIRRRRATGANLASGRAISHCRPTGRAPPSTARLPRVQTFALFRGAGRPRARRNFGVSERFGLVAAKQLKVL